MHPAKKDIWKVPRVSERWHHCDLPIVHIWFFYNFTIAVPDTERCGSASKPLLTFCPRLVGVLHIIHDWTEAEASTAHDLDEWKVKLQRNMQSIQAESTL